MRGSGSSEKTAEKSEASRRSHQRVPRAAEAHRRHSRARALPVVPATSPPGTPTASARCVAPRSKDGASRLRSRCARPPATHRASHSHARCRAWPPFGLARRYSPSSRAQCSGVRRRLAVPARDWRAPRDSRSFAGRSATSPRLAALRFASCSRRARRPTAPPFAAAHTSHSHRRPALPSTLRAAVSQGASRRKLSLQGARRPRAPGVRGELSTACPIPRPRGRVRDSQPRQHFQQVQIRANLQSHASGPTPPNGSAPRGGGRGSRKGAFAIGNRSAVRVQKTQQTRRTAVLRRGTGPGIESRGTLRGSQEVA